MSGIAGFTEEQLQKQNVVVGKCADELGIELNSDFTEQWTFNGNLFPDEETPKKFVVCIVRALGVMDADGTFKLQALVDFLGDNHDVPALKKHTTKCNMEGGDTVEDRTYNIYKCFWDEETKQTFKIE
ncbi:uncharacterized protein LOC131427814 isoform X2 [Malaya genurostris]|uniref:uncharacterized protein LOC131427814 isoform X2 n=1 Tax=Malaya genurostris TaxID=325434 RepID=UPI0026F3F57D|nr:uncharacterized protein LOC131427814 isoform X2 [Malaya genurostris]